MTHSVPRPRRPRLDAPRLAPRRSHRRRVTVTDLRPLVDSLPMTAIRQRVVLDTSVLIADPSCIGTFTDVDLVVPLTVIEELDGLKNRLDDVGRSARTALRAIEELRISNGGTLAEPMPIGSCTLQIEINSVQKHRLVEHGLDPASPDNRIIGAALGQAERGRRRWCPTMPHCASRRRTSESMAAEHRRTVRTSATPPSGGHRSTSAARWSIGCTTTAPSRLAHRRIDALVENEFAVLRAGSQSALTRRVGNEWRCCRTALPRPGACAPAPRSSASPSNCCSTRRSRLSPSTVGPAPARPCWRSPPGSSRWSRTAATSVSPCTGRSCRSDEPTSATCQAGSTRSSTRGCRRSTTPSWRSPITVEQRRPPLVEELTSRGQLSLESVTFLRGRSLQRQIVVIDEAQNLEPTTLKTILTRVGEHSKVVFTGDTSQIDAPYLGESNNALAVLTQAFRGQRCFGHITLTACERSDVASLAAELL